MTQADIINEKSQVIEGTIGHLFDLAIEAEKTAEQLYLIFMEKCLAWPDVAEFWKVLAADERHHAETLETIAREMTGEQLNYPAEPTVLQKAKAVRRLSVEKLLKSVHDLNDAYELAHELENSEVNTTFCFLTTKFVPGEIQKKFMLSEIKLHQARLIKFPQTQGGLEWRKGIPISA